MTAEETEQGVQRCRVAWLMAASASFTLQEFQDHLSEGQHQQRLGEIQHSSQTCLLSLLPMPRDILEREAE